jgi:hypothetical protein
VAHPTALYQVLKHRRSAASIETIAPPLKRSARESLTRRRSTQVFLGVYVEEQLQVSLVLQAGRCKAPSDRPSSENGVNYGRLEEGQQ